MKKKTTSTVSNEAVKAPKLPTLTSLRKEYKTLSKLTAPTQNTFLLLELSEFSTDEFLRTINQMNDASIQVSTLRELHKVYLDAGSAVKAAKLVKRIKNDITPSRQTLFIKLDDDKTLSFAKNTITIGPKKGTANSSPKNPRRGTQSDTDLINAVNAAKGSIKKDHDKVVAAMSKLAGVLKLAKSLPIADQLKIISSIQANIDAKAKKPIKATS